jgi:redox-sensitive bicupin YhaK (pirin superfamily)
MVSETFYADVNLEPASRQPMPNEHDDRGIYIVDGSVSIAGQTFEAGRMMVFRPGARITDAAGDRGARLMILGGATLGGPRYIWWNFVASSRERIAEAKAEWRAENWGKGRFELPIDDRDEHIPLPD